MPRSTGAKIDVDAHLPIPPHLRDVPSIFLEESPTSGIYGTDLRARDQPPAPRATGQGFFSPDAADPPTRSRAQQQNIRSMIGSKEVLTRKPQSVPRLPHKTSLLTPSSRQEVIDSMVEQNPTIGARTGLFNLQVSRKGEFEHDERASKRPRYGSSASSALKMNPGGIVEPGPPPIVRKTTAKATAPSTSTASARRSTRLQQGNVKAQIKVR